MADLPDELWRRILEIGVQSTATNSSLTFKDLCCLSISCRRLRCLSNEDSLWSSLLSSDFPHHQLSSSSHSSNSVLSKSKSIYRSRYEKDKERRIAAQRRALLRMESRISEHSRRLQELHARRGNEIDKIKAATAESSNLRKVRQASIALNMWQPEIIRGRQKQIVEQCAVPVDSRINALEMELKLCKQKIMVFEKAYRDENQRLEAAKEKLISMKYCPLQDCSVIGSGVDDHSIKRKKLKRCTSGNRYSKEIYSFISDDSCGSNHLHLLFLVHRLCL